MALQVSHTAFGYRTTSPQSRDSVGGAGVHPPAHQQGVVNRGCKSGHVVVVSEKIGRPKKKIAIWISALWTVRDGDRPGGQRGVGNWGFSCEWSADVRARIFTY